jgi:hypothetical protein
MQDSVTKYVKFRVPEQCDICGEVNRTLQLIGGAKKREWLCPDCIKEAEHMILNSDEFMAIRVEQKRAKDAARRTQARVVEDAELTEKSDSQKAVMDKRKKTGII